jgi:hypothetical protein
MFSPSIDAEVIGRGFPSTRSTPRLQALGVGHLQEPGVETTFLSINNLPYLDIFELNRSSEADELYARFPARLQVVADYFTYSCP